MTEPPPCALCSSPGITVRHHGPRCALCGCQHADPLQSYQCEIHLLRRDNDRLWAWLVIASIGMFTIGDLVGALTT